MEKEKVSGRHASRSTSIDQFHKTKMQQQQQLPSVLNTNLKQHLAGLDDRGAASPRIV